MNHARGFGFTQRDAIVLAVVALMPTPAMIVRYPRSNEPSRRIRCADSLKAIGLALLLSANENRGATVAVRAGEGSPRPTGD